jgi:hypothetical protein
LATSGIGTLNEKPLHEALKRWYAKPGDAFEVPVGRFVVDIVRGNLLIEIQTRNFSVIKRKLNRLLVDNPVRLVYPIPHEKWIVKSSGDDRGGVSRRRSPKRGEFAHVFEELIRFPQLFMNRNFSMEVLLIEEEEVRRYDGILGWRRGGWVTDERRLLRVLDSRVFSVSTEMLEFVPQTLREPFSVTDLAAASGITRRLAQRMVYCLRCMGCLVPAGRRAKSILYTRRTV